MEMIELLWVCTYGLLEIQSRKIGCFEQEGSSDVIANCKEISSTDFYYARIAEGYFPSCLLHHTEKGGSNCF